MMTSNTWFVLITFAAFICYLADAELIELSYTFNKDAPTSPKLTQFEHKVVKKGLTSYKTWVELNDFCTSEHSGTHLDAPVHFSKNSWSVDEIPTKRLFRVPGVKIDLISKSKSVTNYEIKPSDLEEWDATYGPIPDGAVVLIQTGWGRKVGDIDEYSGIDQYDKLNFPGLGVEAAVWLASYGKRNDYSTGIIGVGTDTISLDIGQSVEYPAHVALLKHNIFGLENVAYLDKLAPTGFLLTIMPVKIGGGSGAPARIIAETSYSSGSKSTGIQSLVITMLLIHLIHYII